MAGLVRVEEVMEGGQEALRISVDRRLIRSHGTPLLRDYIRLLQVARIPDLPLEGSSGRQPDVLEVHHLAVAVGSSLQTVQLKGDKETAEATYQHFQPSAADLRLRRFVVAGDRPRRFVVQPCLRLGALFRSSVSKGLYSGLRCHLELHSESVNLRN